MTLISKEPESSPKQVTEVGCVVNVGAMAVGKDTVTSLVQAVFASVMVIVYSPAGTPEKTLPLKLTEDGFGLMA